MARRPHVYVLLRGRTVRLEPRFRIREVSMIHLGYQLSPLWRARNSGADYQRADEGALRYDLFLGDVLFKIDEVDLSARWGWIPVIDFALTLHLMTDALEPNQTKIFEFTESDDS